MNDSLLKLLADLTVLLGKTAEVRVSGGTDGLDYGLCIEAHWWFNDKHNVIQRNLSKREMESSYGDSIGMACERMLHSAKYFTPDIPSDG